MNIRKKIGIFGSSGMARETADVVMALGLDPIFITKNDQDLLGLNTEFYVIQECRLNDIRALDCIIGIADAKIRKRIAKQYDGELNFVNLIHPSATFGYGQLELLNESKGIIVAAGVRITNNVTIGNFSIFNQNATVAHDCEIESFVHIAPGANISGCVKIKEGCWIGAGTIINQGTMNNKLRIGEHTIIGSGSVVTKNCEPNSVYLGSPARRFK